jgi:diguanylate cyclase (GGDEF)-like protein/PAS domain S-box-containing protein
VEQELGSGMQSTNQNKALQLSLETMTRDSALSVPAFNRVIDAGRLLITQVGNQSNLILDPDLDSYYTMSLVVLRFPELQDLLARTAQKWVELSVSPPAQQRRLEIELLILRGRLDSAIKGMSSDYDEAMNAGPAWLRSGMTPTRDALLASLALMGETTDPMRDNRASDALHQLAAQHATTLAATRDAWHQASASLDRLLQARIDSLLERMWLHLGSAAALLVVILGLVSFVARLISQPIRRLAGVADRVSSSGDYSLRADHVGQDEIGQLVKAFNSMLGDLDSDRAVREELAATTRAAEAQRALVESFPTPMIVTSIPDHRVLHANPSALPWLGGSTSDPWVANLEPQARVRFFQRLSDMDAVDGFEVRWRGAPAATRSGGRQWALLSSRRLMFEGQAAMLTAFTPISQIKLLEQRLQLWANVFEASSESIVVFDAERRILTANKAFSRTTGWDVADVAGQPPDVVYSVRHESSFYETIWQSALIRGFWQGEVWLKRKNGQVYPTWMTANAVRDSEGRVTHLVSATVDISEHKESEARIHHLAHHDALTDLPNRLLCLERLRSSIELAGQRGEQVAVVFIDLDRFKNINDSMGHHAGDALLRSVASRLVQAVRPGDTVSRLGGDEFVVILSGLNSLELISSIVAERMVPLVRQPHLIEGVELTVSCSAGIAVFPRDGRDVDHLMRNADAAMYQAKAAGRNNALFFMPEFHTRAQERMSIENDLRHALERQELVLHYQPRMDAATGHMIGVEALVRWMHPERGLMGPGRFISIAEETGQIIAIGAWIFGEACRQQAAWIQDGLGCIPVGINVSAVQLGDPGLAAMVQTALTRHGVKPQDIEIELTETFLMENASATVQVLDSLKEIGVALAIDDFGTGYSSLNYLHQFPIDKLKIDQSFVRNLLDTPADQAIARAIIDLGHTLGLTVVAEGVERDEERVLLRDAGCDELQGYLFGRPMTPAALVDWLRVHGTLDDGTSGMDSGTAKERNTAVA